MVAYLVKSGNQRFTKWIYLGVLAGLAGSGLVAVLFTFLFGGSGPVQEISEGVCALIAMLMLLWTSNWMLNKSSVEAWNRYIRTKTESAVADAQNKVAADEGVGLGMVVSLAMLSFLAVFREGAETVIFYESIYSMSRDAQGMWIGGIAAGVVLLVIFLVLRFTSVKIPIGPFFLVTSILMAVLVVIFAGGGIHALIEGDLIDGHYLSSVPTNDWIGLYPYVECLAAQAIAAIAVLALFAVASHANASCARLTIASNTQIFRDLPIFFPHPTTKEREMKNKKIAALLGILLAGSMAFSLSACGNSNDSAASDKSSASASASKADDSSKDDSSDSAGFEEIQVDEKHSDQECGPLTVNAVYFQPIDMEPSGMGLKAADASFHLEADIHANQKGTELGYGKGDFVPDLTVNYDIIDKTSNASVASGPHADERFRRPALRRQRQARQGRRVQARAEDRIPGEEGLDAARRSGDGCEGTLLDGTDRGHLPGLELYAAGVVIS